MSKESGVYTIPCEVNGLKLRFIFDTGASDVSISLSEAIFMLKNEYMSESDLIGSTYYQIANGDVVEGTSIILRQIKIGDKYIYNVKASIVHSTSAPLLLGQSALSKVGKFTFDYSNETLTFDEDSNRDSYILNQINNREKSFFSTVKSDGQLWREPNQFNRINSISKGTNVRILGYEKGFWKVFVDGITAYILNETLNVTYEMTNFKDREYNVNQSSYNTNSNNSIPTTIKSDGQLWKEPNQFNRINSISKGTNVRVIGYEKGFFKIFVDGITGYIFKETINITFEMSKLIND